MSVQTTYSRAAGTPHSGTPGDTGPKKDVSYLNDEGSDIPAGIGVTLKSEGKIEEFDANADSLAGIVLNNFARNPDSLSGSDAIQAGDMCNVRELGAVYVAVEETVAVGDPVYCRHTSDGADNTQLGKFRNDSDSGKAKLIKGARWLTAGTTTSPALLHFDRSVEAAAERLDAQALKVTLTAGAETSQAIDVVGAVTDLNGNPVTAAKQVWIRSLAVTADKGDLAAASSAVGTVKEAYNPATGPNEMWMETTAAGLFSFKVSNDVAEETGVVVHCDGIATVLKLTFA
jgi:hypothetical protein